MTSPSIPRQDFYVYALFREDSITPFYIGMGINDRWLQHEKLVDPKNSYKNNVIRKMLAAGIRVPRAKLYEGMTRPEAAQMERDLIRLVGRHPIGPLTNKTDGGEGLWNPDEETRAKMRKARERYVCSPETRAKLSKAGRGKKLSDEHKAILAAVNARRLFTAETRMKMSAAKKGRPNGHHNNKRRLGQTQSAETRERIAAAIRKHWATRRRNGCHQ